MHGLFQLDFQLHIRGMVLERDQARANGGVSLTRVRPCKKYTRYVSSWVFVGRKINNYGANSINRLLFPEDCQALVGTIRRRGRRVR